MYLLLPPSEPERFYWDGKRGTVPKSPSPTPNTQQKNFFRLILAPFLKRQEPIDPRRLFCLFAHGTKATPLIWNNEGLDYRILFCENSGSTVPSLLNKVCNSIQFTPEENNQYIANYSQYNTSGKPIHFFVNTQLYSTCDQQG